MRQIWTRGRGAIADALQRQFPVPSLKVTSPIQENFSVGPVSWEYRPLGGAAIAKGIDVGRMKDRKSFTLYVHID
jgi:hypothetical protein